MSDHDNEADSEAEIEDPRSYPVRKILSPVDSLITLSEDHIRNADAPTDEVQ